MPEKVYKIEVAPAARRDLRRLDRPIRERIREAINGLALDPYHNAVKLRGTERDFRIRVGDWRVIYEIIEDSVVVLVLRVRHRREAYRSD